MGVVARLKMLFGSICSSIHESWVMPLEHQHHRAILAGLESWTEYRFMVIAKGAPLHSSWGSFVVCCNGRVSEYRCAFGLYRWCLGADVVVEECSSPPTTTIALFLGWCKSEEGGPREEGKFGGQEDQRLPLGDPDLLDAVSMSRKNKKKIGGEGESCKEQWNQFVIESLLRARWSSFDIVSCSKAELTSGYGLHEWSEEDVSDPPERMQKRRMEGKRGGK